MSSQQHQTRTPVNPSWIWSGIHGVSGTVHPFLAIRDDPHGVYSSLGAFDCVNRVVAGSGGLLLIMRSPPEIEEFADLRRIEENDVVRRIAVLLRTMDLFSAETCVPLQSEIYDQFNDTPEGDEDHNPEGDQDHTPEGDHHHNPEGDQDQASLELSQNWQTLLVVNPSTHESRLLPPANSMEVGLESWSYIGVQPSLLVDTESHTYTVTLTFPYCVCLYTSTSNAWQCRSFNQGDSWGPHNRELSATPWQFRIAQAYVNGRLFFADVVRDDPVHTMNLIEIDVEAGAWKLHNWRYSLQGLETHVREFVSIPLVRMRGLTEHGTHRVFNTQIAASPRGNRVIEHFQIVECMGELYAVIPMGFTEYLPMSFRRQRTLIEAKFEYNNFGLDIMPLQFLIVNMRGDGFVHGVLRILVPADVSSIVERLYPRNRWQDLMDMLDVSPLDDDIWRFTCVAEGSVIWVALLDYVLQYDVVTGVSKTEIISRIGSRMNSEETSLSVLAGVPYRPSDMKP